MRGTFQAWLTCSHPQTASSYAEFHIIDDLGNLFDRSSSKAMQRLGFQIVLQPHQPAFPAVAGLLVASEGRAVVEATAVDMDCPGAQPSSDAQRPLGIASL